MRTKCYYFYFWTMKIKGTVVTKNYDLKYADCIIAVMSRLIEIIKDNTINTYK